MGILNSLTDKMSQTMDASTKRAVDTVMAGNTARSGIEALDKPLIDKVMAGNTARQGVGTLGADYLIAGNTARSGVKTLETPVIDKVMAGNTARHGLSHVLDTFMHPAAALQASGWWQRSFAGLALLFQRLKL